MAGFCSAKDIKPPDTKVTAFILMVTTLLSIPVEWCYFTDREKTWYNVSYVNWLNRSADWNSSEIC